MKYEYVVAEVFGKPWAILPEKLKVITELVALRASGQRLSEEEIQTRLKEAEIAAMRDESDQPRARGSARSQSSYGSVAVIPIQGVISRRANMMSQYSGGTSIEKLTSQFRAALADQSVKAIVFDVDSPGGTVEGVPELADEIYKSRGQKKSIAVANGFAASAAYWLAASAGELAVAPSGQVGSIGVYISHDDLSAAMEKAGVKTTFISAGKYKVDGNETEPLSDSARADMQAKVDAFYGMFVKGVARGRRVSQDDVRGGFGQGRMLLAQAAVKEGMADRVATMDDTLSRMGATDSNPPKMAASADPPSFENSDDGECGCACDACHADDHGNCSNDECADPNCAHPPRAKAAAAHTAALNRRRRKLELH
jgi:signal peptide peptidase SppA